MISQVPEATPKADGENLVIHIEQQKPEEVTNFRQPIKDLTPFQFEDTAYALIKHPQTYSTGQDSSISVGAEDISSWHDSSQYLIIRFYADVEHKELLFLLTENKSDHQIYIESDTSMQVVEGLLRDAKPTPGLSNSPEAVELLDTIRAQLKSEVTSPLSAQEARIQYIKDHERHAQALDGLLSTMLGGSDVPKGDPRRVSLLTERNIQSGDPGTLSFKMNLPSYQEHLSESGETNIKNTLLLGALSASSAQEYQDFIKGLNPSAKPYIAELNPAYISTYSPEAKELALNANALSLPLSDGSMDVVFTNHLMHQLVTPTEDEAGLPAAYAKLITEAKRVLSEGGVLSMNELFDGKILQAGFSDIQAFGEFLGHSLEESGFKNIKVTNSKKFTSREAHPEVETRYDSLSIYAEK